MCATTEARHHYYFEFAEIYPSSKLSNTMISFRRVDYSSIRTPDANEWIPYDLALKVLHQVTSDTIIIPLIKRVSELSNKAEKYHYLRSMSLRNTEPVTSGNFSDFERYQRKCLGNLSIFVFDFDNDKHLNTEEPFYHYLCILAAKDLGKLVYAPPTPKSFIKNIAFDIANGINPYPKKACLITAFDIKKIFNSLLGEPESITTEKINQLVARLQKSIRKIPTNQNSTLTYVENVRTLKGKARFNALDTTDTPKIYLHLTEKTGIGTNNYYLCLSPAYNPVRFLPTPFSTLAQEWKKT